MLERRALAGFFVALYPDESPMRGRQLPWFSMFLDPKPNEGGGSGANGGKGGRNEDDGDDDGSADEAARRFINAGGGKEGEALRQWAMDMWNDNKKLRDQRQRKNARITELEEQVPPEGAVVLAGDEAKAWAAIKELKIPAGDLPAKLKGAAEAEQKLAAYERNDVARQAAELLGYEPDVLMDRLDRDGLHLEVVSVTEKVDGEDVTTQVPKVRKATDAAAQLQDLTAYTETNWAKYKPALLKGDAPSGEQRQPPRPTGRPAPITRSGENRTPPQASIDQLAEAQRSTGAYPRF